MPWHEMILADLFTSEVSDTLLEHYGQALIAIASADGEYAQREHRTTVRVGRMMGIAQEVLAKWESFEWRYAKPRDLLASLRPSLSQAGCRYFIYHALRVATADGTYSIEERDAVEVAGQQLELTMETVHALESLVEMERAVERLKGVLL